MLRHLYTLGSGLLLLSSQCSGQKPAFEVASIKPNISGRDGGTLGPRGEGFFAVNATLVNLLLYAYAPPTGLFLRPQIIGGPEWINTDHFDLEAKPAASAGAVPREQTKAMLQSLLEDRFQLKVRRETRDLPIYNLVPSKGGPKLSQDQGPPDPRQAFIIFASSGDQLTPLPRGAMRMITGPSSSTLTGTAISVSKVVSLLQSKAGRIILDKTGFTGLIDVNIEFSPDLRPPSTDAPDDPSSPSLFTAIQGLGLKLESAKAPLEVLVIDSVQKPSAN
jgi:uncharacterized protein (TIGR03435 family)